MASPLLWFTTLVLGATTGLGILTLGFYVSVAFLPIVLLMVLSRALLVGASGLLMGVGGTWLASFLLAQGACSSPTDRVGQAGCGSTVEQVFLGAALVMLATSAALLAIGMWAKRRAPRPAGREME